MKWTLAITALLAIAATTSVAQPGEELIGLFAWLNDFLVDLKDTCEDALEGVWSIVCDELIGDTECSPFYDGLNTCPEDSLPAQSNWPEEIGPPGKEINIIFELDALLGDAIDAILASEYINDEPACQAALTTYSCKLVMGMMGAATDCNGEAEEYKNDLPCKDDCVNFMRKCFVGAKEDLIDTLGSDEFCLDISDLGVSGYDEFCPFQIDAVSDNIVDFLANDEKFCEKLGHDDDNECDSLNLRATLSGIEEPGFPLWAIIACAVAGVAIVAGVAVAVSKKKNADGDKFDDGKSSASEFSQASEATRADF